MIQVSLLYHQDAHYCIGHNGRGGLLLQLQDETGIQARVILDPLEAFQISEALLRETYNELRTQNILLDRENESLKSKLNNGVVYVKEENREGN